MAARAAIQAPGNPERAALAMGLNIGIAGVVPIIALLL
jgi:hypothetical protein